MTKDKDQIWKRIIEKFFSEFTEFFLPELHQDIDFKHKPKFLDNQLSKIVRKSGGKDRESDKLIEVKLKDGTNRFILVHVEVQSSKDADFSFRMWQYAYRIFDKFNKKVVALAIYTDDNSKFKPNEYKDELYGTGIKYWFNIYKVLEQKDKEDLLKNNDNPFALVVLASIYYLNSQKSDNKRYNFKVGLTELLFEKGYSKDDIYELLEFIDVLLKFKDDSLEDKYFEELEKMPKVKEKEIMGGIRKILKKDIEAEIKKNIETEIKNSQKLEIAKSLKSNGASIELIYKSTGLTKEEIEKL